MHSWTSLAVLLSGSAVLALVAGTAARDPRCHGFYRFFAFEAVLILLALDIPHWFARAWSTSQLLGNALLIASGFLTLHGLSQLVFRGEPRMREADQRAFGFKNTTVLVTGGAYRHVRHPMYTAFLLLAWGLVVKDPSTLRIALGVATTLLVLQTALVEEVENLVRFGDSYRDYMSRTRRFIPFVV